MKEDDRRGVRCCGLYDVYFYDVLINHEAQVAIRNRFHECTLQVLSPIQWEDNCQKQAPTSYDNLVGRLVDKLAMVGLLVKTPYAGEAMLLAYSPGRTKYIIIG